MVKIDLPPTGAMALLDELNRGWFTLVVVGNRIRIRPIGFPDDKPTDEQRRAVAAVEAELLAFIASLTPRALLTVLHVWLSQYGHAHDAATLHSGFLDQLEQFHALADEQTVERIALVKLIEDLAARERCKNIARSA